jgi:hypothetical protein
MWCVQFLSASYECTVSGSLRPLLRLSVMRSAYCCRTVYSTDLRPTDINGMTNKCGMRRVHIAIYNISEDLGTETL